MDCIIPALLDVQGAVGQSITQFFAMDKAAILAITRPEKHTCRKQSLKASLRLIELNSGVRRSSRCLIGKQLSRMQTCLVSICRACLILLTRSSAEGRRVVFETPCEGRKLKNHQQKEFQAVGTERSSPRGHMLPVAIAAFQPWLGVSWSSYLMSQKQRAHRPGAPF
jgi:hypothetical protein